MAGEGGFRIFAAGVKLKAPTEKAVLGRLGRQRIENLLFWTMNRAGGIGFGR